MKKMRNVLALAIGVGAVPLLSASQAASAGVAYTVTDLGGLGGSITEAFGINNQGEITGDSTTAINTTNGTGGYGQSFLWKPSVPNGTTGTMYSIDPSYSSASYISDGLAINGQGQVAGVEGSSSGYQTFLWTPSQKNGVPGSLANLNIPKDAGTWIYGMNSSGQVVGESGSVTPSEAFLWTPDAPNGTTGSTQQLGFLPGTTNSWAGDINDNGEVVGSSGNMAFIWTPSGGMQALATPAGDGSAADGVNSAGEIAGYITTSSTVGGATELNYRAAIWTAAGIQILPTLGGQNSAAAAINAAGEVVGWSQASDGSYDVFAYQNGVMTDLNVLTGYQFGSVYGINDSGQIITDYTDASNHRTAYLLTPVVTPEPGSASIMLLLTLGSVILLKKRRLRHVLEPEISAQPGRSN